MSQQGVWAGEGEIRNTGNCTVSLPSKIATAGQQRIQGLKKPDPKKIHIGYINNIFC
jgi:hypothetical protein